MNDLVIARVQILPAETLSEEIAYACSGKIMKDAEPWVEDPDGACSAILSRSILLLRPLTDAELVVYEAMSGSYHGDSTRWNISSRAVTITVKAKHKCMESANSIAKLRYERAMVRFIRPILEKLRASGIY